MTLHERMADGLTKVAARVLVELIRVAQATWYVAILLFAAFPLLGVNAPQWVWWQYPLAGLVMVWAIDAVRKMWRAAEAAEESS